MAANIAHIPGGILPFRPSNHESNSSSRSNPSDVIDVKVKRITVDESRRKTQAESSPVSNNPNDIKARRMAEIEAELLKPPFRYERSYPGGDIQLKLPPLRRGILIDEQA